MVGGGKSKGRGKGKRKPGKGSNKGSMQSLRKEVNLIKKTLIETKYYDELNNFTPLNTGQSFCLNNFAQGDTVVTCNGDKVFVERIDLRYIVQTNSALVGPVHIRVLIVEDTSPNGQAVNLGIGGSAVILGPTGVLDNTVITGAPEIMPHSFEMRYRYKIHHDRTFTLNPQMPQTTTVATGVVSAITNKAEHVHVSLPIHKTTVYIDGTANIASIMKGSYIALCFSDQSANAPFVVMGTRVFFKDA